MTTTFEEFSEEVQENLGKVWDDVQEQLGRMADLLGRRRVFMAGMAI